MSELTQVRAELQSVRGLLENVLIRLDQIESRAVDGFRDQPVPVQALSIPELARDIQIRGPKAAMKDFRARQEEIKKELNSPAARRLRGRKKT